MNKTTAKPDTEERDEFGAKLDKLVQKVENVQLGKPRSRKDWHDVARALKELLPGAKVNTKEVGYIVVEIDSDGFLSFVVQGCALGYTVSTLANGFIIAENVYDSDGVVYVVRKYLMYVAAAATRALAG